jgi:hypothetical protein
MAHKSTLSVTGRAIANYVRDDRATGETARA